MNRDNDGNWIKSWGEPGDQPGQFSTPHSIAVDAGRPRLRGRPWQSPHPGIRLRRKVWLTSGWERRGRARAAVRRHAGEAALIQRCQVHKRRNVVDHLPKEHKPAVKKKLQNAYSMTEYADAKRALERLHRELMELNPSAARSLEEGMEETLTVHRLRVPSQLRRTLASTNVIESAFSIVETVCRNVKRWRAGDHIERWVGSGLLVAERQFRKVQGYREIPSLLTALANTVSKQAVAEEAKVA